MSSCDCRPERLRARLAGREWRLIEDGAAPGAWNMALDEALLEAARRDAAPPTLRLYGWARPTLSLGRHQARHDGIDHDFRRRRGIDLVRRPTGGRAVLHDRDVTYSILLPRSLARGAGVGEVYQVLTGALLAGLDQLFGCSGVPVLKCPGVDSSTSTTETPERLNAQDHRVAAVPPERLNTASCFATAAGGDALVGAGKLVGSAQARRAGAVLQHGSLLLQVRREEWIGLFGGTGLAVALDALLGAPPAEEVVRSALRRGLECELEATLVLGSVGPAERSVAERLATERYGAECLN